MSLTRHAGVMTRALVGQTVALVVRHFGLEIIERLDHFQLIFLRTRIGGVLAAPSPALLVVRSGFPSRGLPQVGASLPTSALSAGRLLFLLRFGPLRVGCT